MKSKLKLKTDVGIDGPIKNEKNKKMYLSLAKKYDIINFVVED